MTELEELIQDWEAQRFRIVQVNEVVEGVEYIHIATYNLSNDPIFEEWWNPVTNSFYSRE